MSREQWWLINLTNNPISIGDLPNLPTINGRQKIDMLKHLERDDILTSNNLIGVIRLGWAKIEKELDGVIAFTATTAGQAKKLLDVTERDELEDDISEIPEGSSGGLNQYGSGTFTQSAPGSNVGGVAATAGMTIASLGDGGMAFGQVLDSAGIIRTSAGGDGGMSFGWVYGTGGGRLDVTGTGGLSHGRIINAGVITSSSGALAGGGASGSGSIITAGYGCFAHGATATAGTITAYGGGTIAFGNASTSGQITSGGAGCFVGGRSVGTGSSINALRNSCFAFGNTNDGGTITAGYGASDFGAIAMGRAEGASAVILAGATAAFSGGYAGAGETISSTAAGAFQWGPGVNSVQDSLQVGASGTGIHLHSTTPGAPANGDLWVANNYTYIRSNGVSVKIT